MFADLFGHDRARLARVVCAGTLIGFVAGCGTNDSESEAGRTASGTESPAPTPATTETGGETWKGTAATRLAGPDASASGADEAAEPLDRTERQLEASELEMERNELLGTAEMAIALLEDEQPEAARLNEKAYGYAVFDGGSVGLLVSGAGGAGVAIAKETNEPTFMYMGSAGAGLTAGGQEFQLVLFFENEAVYEDFVAGELDGSAIAQAAMGAGGATEILNFEEGVAAFQRTEGGLVAGALLRATYFWPSEELNADGGSRVADGG